MAERVVSVKLQAKVDGFTSGMRKAKASVDDLTKADLKKPQAAFADLANKSALMATAVGAGIAVAVKRFADFDQAMSAVKANSGATGAELEALRASAIQLGADSQFSATEAAQGINELAKAGVNSQAILSGGLKGALDLAAAGQIEVGQAAETAASAMTQFNLSGNQTSHVADLLTNGANKAQGGVLDLGMALKQAGLVAASTGLSIDETTAGLTAFAAAGLVGSDAGTSFKTMLQRLSAPSDEAKKLMGDLGISAYDAQGNFVGLANVAGQLRRGMENLTPAQRNAALATIFGSDAVRAANVLYNEGEQGIRKWTDAVTEQGAAAKQAATLTDNLKGDLERLGGALDSAFIQTGSSANDGLRTLVQGLTGIVDVIGKIPGPVLLAGTALAGIALALPKGISTYRQFQGSLEQVGLSMDKVATKAPRVGNAMKAAAAAAKVYGAALTGAAVAGGILAQFYDDNQIGPEQLTEKLSASSDAVAVLNKQMADLASGGPLYAKSLDSIDSVLQAATNPDWNLQGMEAGSRALNVLSLGFIDLETKVDVADKRLAGLDTTLAGMVSQGNGDQARRVFQALADSAAAQGISVDDLKAKLPQYSEALAGVNNSARDAAGGTSTLTGATKDAKEAAEDAKTALDNLKNAIDGLGSAVAQQRAADRAFQSAIDDASAAVETYGRKGKQTADQIKQYGKVTLTAAGDIDTNTEAGRALAESLDKIRQATLDKVKADFEAKGGVNNLTEATKAGESAMKNGRKAFLDAADAAGVSKTEAKNLADQLGLIPDNVNIVVSQSGAEEAATAIKNAAVDRTATIWVTRRFRETDLSSEYQGVGGRATGGAIYGPGSGTSDTAGVFRLSNGEHVLTAAEVMRMGGQSAVYAFRKSLMSGRVPGYAQGGAVQYAPRVQVVSVPSQPVMTSSDQDNRIFIDKLYSTDERSFRRAAQQRRASRYNSNARAS